MFIANLVSSIPRVLFFMYTDIAQAISNHKNNNKKKRSYEEWKIKNVLKVKESV